MISLSRVWVMDMGMATSMATRINMVMAYVSEKTVMVIMKNK